MMRRVVLSSLLVFASSLSSFSQQPPAVSAQATEVKQPEKIESATERLKRLGTLTDPGRDPDPKAIWTRMGARFTIEKFPKKGAVYDSRPGTVRPLGYINVEREIYQEDAENVWVWHPYYDDLPPVQPPVTEPGSKPAPPTAPSSQSAYLDYTAEQFEFVKQLKAEFSEVVPPVSGKTIRFRESSTGLPTGGSWRNSLDVADMNNDGHLDIIVPPQRGGYDSSRPFIFLGDSKGIWKMWENIDWPAPGVYGSVIAGDLNGDKNMDLVLGMHLSGIAAFLGDGKGGFTDSSTGLPEDFPTRRASLVDYDLDGDLDIVALSEGPSMQVEGKMPLGLFRMYVNEGKAKSWRRLEISDEKRQLAGDYIAIGKFNRDKYPDFAAASIFFHGTDVIHLSEGKGRWSSFGRGWLPFYSYYNGVVAGRFTKSLTDDVIYAFSRTWPTGADPKRIESPPFNRLVGLELISFANGKKTRTPITRSSSTRSVFAIGSTDVDGDKNLDVAYFKPEKGEIVMLLGDGKGRFSQAVAEGVKLGMHTMYDLKFADVNADGRPDLVLMFEELTNAKDGSVRVFLNEGVTAATRK